MADRNLIYSNASVSSTDGVVSLKHHTDSISFMNQSSSAFCNIKLNGRFTIRIGYETAGYHYDLIEGDFTTFQILTEGVNVSVFAVG
jgi:hypothetical protein